MAVTHIFIALFIALIWGVNFLFVKVGLMEISPLLLCAIRFTLASIPAIFFIKPPAIPFSTLALYGLTMFGLQFAFVFMGMYVGMTPGMASVIMQVQVFFSLFFAAFFLGEPTDGWQILGALVAFGGIGIVAFHCDKNISLAGFLFILAAAASWGLGNLITKKIKSVNMMSLVVWGSFISCFPMLALSWVVEGPQSLLYTYHHLTYSGVMAVLYIVYASTWVGYGAWNWLISRYPVGMIVPFTLLVPIVGMLSSSLILGESLPLWKATAGLLVIGGLFIHLLGARLRTIAAVGAPATLINK